jgi:hypothetical protein
LDPIVSRAPGAPRGYDAGWVMAEDFRPVSSTVFSKDLPASSAKAELGKDLGKELGKKFVFADGASRSISAALRCPVTMYADSRYAVRGRGIFFFILASVFLCVQSASRSISVRCPGTMYADSRYAVRGRGIFFFILASVVLCVQSTVQSTVQSRAQLSAADPGPAHAAGALVTQKRPSGRGGRPLDSGRQSSMLPDGTEVLAPL